MDASEEERFARNPSAGRIAELNDHLRKSDRGGHFVVTCGVRTLPDFDPVELMTAVAAFDSFDEANDPYGERDFGGVDLWGAELLWKIDYYEHGSANASPDPADERVTNRVLTVMLAEEY